MDLTTSTYSLSITKKRCVSLLDSTVFNKWGLERRMTLEEERARKEAREETRVQMQVLNEHVAALCASECLNANYRCLILNVI